MQNRLKRKIVLWGVSFIFILAGWLGAQPVSAGTELADRSAIAVFRSAYNNRYNWESDFPGYAARVAVSVDGETHTGQIRVNPDLSVEVTGIEDEEAAKEVKDGLDMLITHRRSQPFDAAHQEHRFNFGETTANGAIEIDQIGGTPSYYLVADDKIIQVNRLIGDIALKVDLLETEETPGGYLGTKYRALFMDDFTGQQLAEVQFEDRYEKIGGYYIPTHQTVRTLESGEVKTTELDLSAIELL